MLSGQVFILLSVFSPRSLIIFLLLTSRTFVSSRSARSTIENLAFLAFEHGVKVREFGSCQVPRPEIVYAHTDSPSKVYLPRGTILHRCSDATGCCPQATQSCQPVQSDIVHLYFFTVSLVQTNSSSHQHHHHRHKKLRQQQSVEKLTFINHTQCACIDRSKVNGDRFQVELNEVWWLLSGFIIYLNIDSWYDELNTRTMIRLNMSFDLLHGWPSWWQIKKVSVVL